MGKPLYFIFFPGSSSRAGPGAHAACLFSAAFIPSHKGPQQDPSWQNLALICRAERAELAPLPGWKLGKSPFADAGKPGWREEALWSERPDPEQMKVDGEVAAGPAPAPAGRELHNRMGLGMVLGLNWVKHVAVAVRSCPRCCAGVGRPRGRMEGWADKKIHREVGQAGFGEEHPCSGFIPLLFLPQSLLPPGFPAWKSCCWQGHEDSIPLSAGR